MKNLIPMTDFVLESENKCRDNIITLKQTFSYANFLKQKLELWMFVPCDLDGNVLERLNFTADGYPIYDGGSKYKEAKERCLFEGFDVVANTNFVTIWQLNGKYLNWDKDSLNFTFFYGFNIERLMQEFNLKLTPTAQKQIGL